VRRARRLEGIVKSSLASRRRLAAVVVLLGLGPLAASAPAGDLPGAPVKRPTGAAAEAETDRWMRLVRDEADDGGWLVVRGSHVGDQAVAAATLGTLSHAAVLDKQKGEVIEALAGGVVVTPVRRLIAQAYRLVIVRPPGWTPEEGRAAVARARTRVGREYDWLGLVGAQQDARFYCTELAVDAYRGRERGWKLGRIIFPADVPALGTVLVDTGPRGGGILVEPRFARRLTGARGVAYAAEVAPGLYRGGQPDEEGIAWLKSIGVRTILNLRHFHGDTEGERAAAAGLRYERIPLKSSGAPTRAQVARFLELVNDPGLRPLYVHCLHGVDRTGAMMAVYRMQMEDWPNAEAFAEMEYFEAHPIWRDLRAFVRGYRKIAR
jgi:protein tyrosine phosphatase (PTP) superfamily phosphohydrolase (DUF442 family)